MSSRPTFLETVPVLHTTAIFSRHEVITFHIHRTRRILRWRKRREVPQLFDICLAYFYYVIRTFIKEVLIFNINNKEM